MYNRRLNTSSRCDHLRQQQKRLIVKQTDLTNRNFCLFDNRDKTFKSYIVFRCDGSLIPAPSPWEGEKTPNLNGEERFLRGGLDGVQLHTEEDSLQAHTHGVSDSGHSHGYTDKWPDSTISSSNIGPCCATPNWAFDGNHNIVTASTISNVAVTSVNGARTGDETRPKNMRVVYIMKVF